MRPIATRQDFSALRLLKATVVLLAASFTGCGGDTSSATGALTRAVTFNVAWSALSASVPARSAIVTIRHANSDGSDSIFTITRPTGTTAEVSQTYGSPTGAVPGARELLVQFFSSAAPSGAVALRLDTRISVTSGVGATVPISLARSPTTVAVVPGQQVVVGDTIQCLYQATDGSGDLIPIQPGQTTCALVSGGSFLGVSGINLTGVASGVATVVANLGMLTSAPATIQVTAP